MTHEEDREYRLLKLKYEQQALARKDWFALILNIFGAVMHLVTSGLVLSQRFELNQVKTEIKERVDERATEIGTTTLQTNKGLYEWKAQYTKQPEDVEQAKKAESRLERLNHLNP